MKKLLLIAIAVVGLAMPRHADAASAFVQYKLCTGAVQTVTCSSLTATAGNTLVVMGHIVAATGAVSVAGNGNTYTQKVSSTSGDCTAIGGGGRAMFMFEADNIASGATVVVVTVPAGVTGMAYVVELSGVAASAYDTFDCDSANSATASAGPTATTAFANEMVIVLFSINGAQSASLPSGYTNIVAQVDIAGNRLAYKNVTATGTQSASATLTSAIWWGLIVTLKDTVQPSAGVRKQAIMS